eukprot:jgi/Hompol1/1630/HPOL_005677-RA
MPLQRLMRMVQSERLIKAVGRLLIRAKKLSQTPITHWINPSRVLLSAFMITGHPAETLQNVGPQEEDLKLLAEKMLADFEAWLAGSASDNVASLGKAFLASYNAYYEAFEQWKSQDTVKIVDDMITHFLDLERLWLSVRGQEDAETEWGPRIEEQQHRIFARLSKFGQSALDKLDAERHRQATQIPDLMQEQRQREATMRQLIQLEQQRLDDQQRQEQHELELRQQQQLRSTSPQLFRAASPSRNRNQDSVTHRRRTSGHSLRTTAVISSTTDASMVSGSDREVPDVTAPIPTEFGHLFSNEQLAHELVLDPNFSLKPAKRTVFEEQVSLIARRAFTDALREEIDARNYTHHVMGVLRTIKQNLLAMVTPESSVGREINSVFDFDLQLQQMSNGVFDLSQCIQYVGTKMLQLCAPMRDASIRALATETDIATILSRTLEIQEDMKLDLTNYRLQSLKPHLQRHAVSYERDKFSTALRNGQASLARTTEWLTNAVNALSSVAAARNPENIDHPELRPKYEDVFHAALLGTIFASVPVTPVTVPETFVMDAGRLYGFQNEAQALTIVSALLMLTKNIVPELRGDLPALKDLKDKLFVLLEDAGTNLENLSLQIVSSINQSFERRATMINGLSARTSPAPVVILTSEQEALIRNMVDKTLSSRDPVFTLISRRIQSSLRQHLERGQFRRDSLASHGLDLVSAELENLSSRIYTLAKHNKEVYSSYYDDILRSLIQ